ncbi:hypothetical protein ABZT17_26875 [Streptomyces sp. NPDC005648]|uniref:hypothetical protein n=1 Tax=Streptomyces sp. NPDC005648 TaxID=3157044 RepID=UPI0033BAB3A2
MSSTYHIFCLGHDPAIAITGLGHNRPDQAEAAIRDDTDSHARCDLIIARYSGGLVELGCPPSYPVRDGAYRCGVHSRTQWVMDEWLTLLAAAYQSDDEAVKAAAEHRGFSCWPWDRLRRLGAELNFTVKEA